MWKSDVWCWRRVEKISCTDLVKNEEVLRESWRKRTSYIRQEKQCTYNVILGRVRVTIFAVKKESLLHIPNMCLLPKLSSTQRACAILYCQLWPVWLHCFSTLSHNWHDSWEKVVKRKMRVLFSPQFFFLKCVHSEENSVRWNHKCILVFM